MTYIAGCCRRRAGTRPREFASERDGQLAVDQGSFAKPSLVEHAADLSMGLSHLPRGGPTAPKSMCSSNSWCAIYSLLDAPNFR
jgi:hypothetical protein